MRRAFATAGYVGDMASGYQDAQGGEDPCPHCGAQSSIQIEVN